MPSIRRNLLNNAEPAHEIGLAVVEGKISPEKEYISIDYIKEIIDELEVTAVRMTTLIECNNDFSDLDDLKDELKQLAKQLY